jgi:hypothetical protein
LHQRWTGKQLRAAHATKNLCDTTVRYMHSLGAGDGEGLAEGGGDGEVEGEGLGVAGAGKGLGGGAGSMPRSSCPVLPHSLKGPLLAAVTLLRTNPRFDATTSAKMSALRKRSENVDAAAARMVRPSVSLTKRWACLGLYNTQSSRAGSMARSGTSLCLMLDARSTMLTVLDCTAKV